MTNAQATVASLSSLAGGVILGATLGDAGFPAVLVRMPDGSRWWIDLQSDAEGNGPGFANVERAQPANTGAAATKGGARCGTQPSR